MTWTKSHRCEVLELGLWPWPGPTALAPRSGGFLPQVQCCPGNNPYSRPGGQDYYVMVSGSDRISGVDRTQSYQNSFRVISLNWGSFDGPPLGEQSTFTFQQLKHLFQVWPAVAAVSLLWGPDSRLQRCAALRPSPVNQTQPSAKRARSPLLIGWLG